MDGRESFRVEEIKIPTRLLNLPGHIKSFFHFDSCSVLNTRVLVRRIVGNVLG